jgi:ubiquinone/menaquinone biosynthesis C-methylase UbiE
VTEPQAFLHELRESLKPEGRLVLVEFRAEDKDVPIRAEHKMTAEQVIAELALGGFRLTERQEFLPWQHLLVFVPAR